MTQRVANLADLLVGLPDWKVQGSASVVVSGIQVDSRRVGPGDVFVALPGASTDGHRFVDQAFRAGAVACVVSGAVAPVGSGTLVQVSDTREALARMAAEFHGRPAERLHLVGVTGTNGKTTVTYLLEEMIRQAGGRPGVIGTVDIRYGTSRFDNPYTTPQATELQALLRQMLQAQVNHVVMEVSSHALDQKRVLDADFQVGAFTNLTRDHLDYHGDLDRYAAAKALLFSRELTNSRAKDRAAVIHLDDPRSASMIADWSGRTLCFSASQAADVCVESGASWNLDGIQARLLVEGGGLQVRSRLTGRHNLENILCAVACAHALGIDRAAIEAGIEAVGAVPGRLERVDAGSGPAVFVDYAHTDHALHNVLGALRPLTDGQLIVVFGCGGDRDGGKRPLMGRAVAEHADLAVVTSDNPRSENPAAIIQQILPGLREQGWQAVTESELADRRAATYAVVADRREAIRLATRVGGAGDVLVIAGKGHEDYQLVGRERLHFDDREEARKALSEAGWRVDHD